MTKTRKVAVVGLLSTLLFAGCAESPEDAPAAAKEQYEFTGPAYQSVRELAAHSHVVVQGRVIGELATGEVYGKEGPVPGPDGSAEPGMEMTFYTFEVSQFLAGKSPGRTLTLGWIGENTTSEQIQPIGNGEVVLFLEQLVASDWPSIEALIDGDFYIPTTGSDNSVMNVADNNTVSARSKALTVLEGKSRGQAPLVASIDDVGRSAKPDVGTRVLQP